MRIEVAILAGALAFASVQKANAQSEPFYKGKTITIVVGSSAGGGYDAYARLFARHFGRHVPGAPSVVVSNMPGAAGLNSVLYLDRTAAKDGTFINTFDPATITDSRMGVSQLKIDFRNYNWIGSISQGTTGCYIWHATGVKNIADAKTRKGLHFGLNSAGSPNDMNQKIMRKILGVELQTIAGYSGAGETTLAVQRGELDGFCGAWTSIPKDWIASKLIVPLMRAGPFTPAGMPGDTPYVADLAPTPQQEKIIRFLVETGEISRPFIASASVPAERMTILRNAFDMTMRDSAFLSDADREQLPISPKNAAVAAQIVNDIYGASDEIALAARAIAGE